jgi:hypothetical protein
MRRTVRFASRLRLFGGREASRITPATFCNSRSISAICARPNPALAIAFAKRSNQVQERLMLGVSLPFTEKCADVHLGHPTA